MKSIREFYTFQKGSLLIDFKATCLPSSPYFQRLEDPVDEVI